MQILKESSSTPTKRPLMCFLHSSPAPDFLNATFMSQSIQRMITRRENFFTMTASDFALALKKASAAAILCTSGLKTVSNWRWRKKHMKFSRSNRKIRFQKRSQNLLSTSKKPTSELIAILHHFNLQSGNRLAQLLKAYRGELLQLRLSLWNPVHSRAYKQAFGLSFKVKPKCSPALFQCPTEDVTGHPKKPRKNYQQLTA